MAVSTVLTTRGVQPFRRGRPLFSPLDWRVETGQFWLLAGANGCGKSTLLETLAGLHANFSGHVMLAGQAIDHWSARARARQVSYLPQHEEATPNCSVREALHMGRYAWGCANTHWQQTVVKALCLGDLMERPLTALSGGQRRAVELATALVQDAPLLLLDEPLNQFDMAFRLRVLDFLAAQRQKAIVMASHDLLLVPRHASHALLIFADGHTRQGAIADMIKRDQLAVLLDWPQPDALDRLWKN